ncbi:MAG: M48 family metallopeptidase [Halanaerobiales bacterium]
MINEVDFIHPLEEIFFEEMMRTIGFDKQIMFYYKNYTQKMEMPDLIGKTVKATENQFTKLYQLNQELSNFIGIETPDIYVYEDFYYGVESKGAGPYWIEISAKTLWDFSEQELKFLLAREIADIYLKHTYYYTMIDKLLDAIQNSGSIVGSDTLKNYWKIVMYKWSRVSHYSSDNFGYLLTSEMKVCVSSIVKLILNNKYLAEKINIAEYIRQSEEINEFNDNVSNLTKMDEKVPYGPFRIKNLLAYASSTKGKKSLIAIN